MTEPIALAKLSAQMLPTTPAAPKACATCTKRRGGYAESCIPMLVAVHEKQHGRALFITFVLGL